MQTEKQLDNYPTTTIKFVRLKNTNKQTQILMNSDGKIRMK